MSFNVQKYKRNLVLNIINHLGPISRTELIQLTGLRPANVGSIIKDLLDEQIIVEAGSTSSGQGRKRVLLAINSSHLYAIAITVQCSALTIVAACVDGTILREETIPALSKDVLRDSVLETVKQMLSQFRDKEILGIGIAESTYDPTLYKLEQTLAYNRMHYHDWIRNELVPPLEALSGLPVQIYHRENEVSLSAIAQNRYGIAKGVDDFILIFLVNGIGCSIFSNGSPVRGAKALAGEIGHTVMDFGDPNPPICYCGKPGCIEAHTAFPALVAMLEAALKNGASTTLHTHMDPQKGITVEAIRKALDEQDQLCMHCVKTVARRLGVVIANVVNLLNPEVVVLTGFMLGLGDYYLKHLEEAARENTLSFSQDFEFRISLSLDSLLPLGIVSVIFDTLLEAKDYKWVYQLQPSELEEYRFSEIEE